MIKLIDTNNDKALNVSDDNQMFKLYKPSLKEFQDTINEFYWISLYVAKAINREEDLQAITFYQNYFLKMLTKMISFKIGHDNNYQVSLGKNYRFIKKYLDKKEYDELLDLFYIKNMSDIYNKLVIGFSFFENYVYKVSQDLGYEPEDFSKIKDFIKAKY
jgi:aminoglycoside 6-adenylyltransferase